MDTVKTYTVEEAKRKLEAFCAYQERYHKEVIDKLQKMRMIPIAIDEIVVHLIQNNFLNEERFAKSFARGKFRYKKWGRIRIVRELKQRGLSTYIIQSALKEIDNEEYIATFEILAEKKQAEIKEKSVYKAKRKLADYLLYRGWESDLVYDKVNELYE
ncbi:regulatory protein RecX [Capnocytophaga cynodegmi]|uniref:Regulatory protein RecX n=1 Tax=Capnocytophaga cynodegmi TaxID=28189 RepID=A0A0B7HV95_9FLAO|nr:regulatory protein RecX [Capnocytophaga cynodegmi]GJQ07412.1 recombinase RecX [Capnocytophaga cynodegmi]CEN33432.1 Regulatory protein [Capnocytophaga cynodegmi]CEN41817.1 Regulatory protein [Capnocytophaga cynodegmi]